MVTPPPGSVPAATRIRDVEKGTGRPAGRSGRKAGKREASSSRIRARWRWLLASALALVVTGLVVTTAYADRDGGRDLLDHFKPVGRDFLALRWQYTCVVLALAALHYLASAVAARAAAGTPLPLGQTVLVQLAASAANRLTPAGLGASAVNVRYFARRGLPVASAMGAMAALTVLGAVADVIALSVVLFGGRWLGLSGGGHEITVLASHVAHMAAPLGSRWLRLVAIAVASGLVVVWIRSRRAGHTRRWRQFFATIGHLVRRPSSLATLLVASGATTVILGVAFVAVTAVVPGPRPDATLGALLIGYLVGAAAGSAVPIPAGIGSSETALIAILTEMHVPVSHAVEQVLIFRILTFWLPAAVGVFAARRLHRQRAL
jgi:uncharacterized membrane protein YbhN (UPF0104 family)